MSKFTHELRDYACGKKASDSSSLGCQFTLSQIRNKKCRYSHCKYIMPVLFLIDFTEGVCFQGNSSTLK